MRPTGIEAIGTVPWGTHFCQFYQDESDLIDILVPYFKAGLESNEFCMWVTSEPLRAEKAKEALARAVRGLDGCLHKGQIEILNYDQWYTTGGMFDAGRVLDGWVRKLEAAVSRGFDGLRLSGNTFWLEKSHWEDFKEYEAAVNAVIGKYPMLALCTYSLGKCGAIEIMDVVSNHSFALIQRGGKWQVIESAERKHVEASLRRSEERYRSLFNCMSEGFALHEILCDENGQPCDYRFLEVNPAFEQLTGLKREDILGKTMRQILSGDDPKWIETYGKVALSGASVHFENYSPVLKRHYEVFASCPAPLQFAVLFLDVTARKRAEEALQRANERLEHRVIERTAQLSAASAYARRLIEASLDPLVTISPFGKITDVNKATEDATGINRTKLIGSDFSDYFTDPEMARSGYRRVLHEGFVRDYPLTIRHDSGRTMDVLYNATVYRDETGAAQGVFAAARDITQRRKAEEELDRYRKHLEELVQQRTLDLERSTAELERSNKDLEQFAYACSHDLQEPLRMVSGFLQLLELKYKGQLDTKGEEYIHHAVDGAKRMQSLTNDLLTYARLGTAGVLPQATDSGQGLKLALSNLNLSIEESKAQVTVGCLPTVRADRAQLTQVFQNLLGNAIKFRSEQPLRIHVDACRDGDAWVFSVRDNGIGIDPEYFKRIFVIFQRLHSRDKYPGTGIGLAICKRIVDRHGGRIWVESKPGEGSTFYFALPTDT